MEKTYVMLKPDAVRRGLIGEIITRIERKNLKITNIKMFNLTENVLKEHYAHIVDKPFFPNVLKFMLSGPVVGMIVEGDNAVLAMRQLIGATKWQEAQPGTVRADYANGEASENLIHASDSIESAQEEIERFFK